MSSENNVNNIFTELGLPIKFTGKKKESTIKSKIFEEQNSERLRKCYPDRYQVKITLLSWPDSLGHMTVIRGQVAH